MVVYNTSDDMKYAKKAAEVMKNGTDEIPVGRTIYLVLVL